MFRLEQHKGVILLRKILMNQDSSNQSLIQKIFDLKMIPKLLQFMMMSSEQPHLVLESTWCLANLTVGNVKQIDLIVNKGLLQILKKILLTNYNRIFEQGVWIVGNISVEGVIYRQKMLELEFGDILSQKIFSCRDQELVKNIAWAMSNLCRGDYCHQKLQNYVDTFVKILQDFSDSKETVIQAVNALNDISNYDILKVLIARNFLKTLKKISSKYSQNKEIMIPVTDIICIISSNEAYLNHKLDEIGLIEDMMNWLRNEKAAEKLIKNILYSLSNILIESDEFVGIVLNTQENFETLLNLCYHSKTNLRREAVWCLASVTKSGSDNRKNALVSNGILGMFKDNLGKDQDQKIILVVLEALGNLMGLNSRQKEEMLGGGDTAFVADFEAVCEEIGLTDRLEQLQLHSDLKVVTHAQMILETYFSLEILEGDVLSNLDKVWGQS